MSFTANLLGKTSKSDAETVTLMQSIEDEQEQSLIDLFDEEEFMELDNKIKEGEATEEEDQKFSKIVPQMAKIQVKDYKLTPEEEKQLLVKHKAKFHQHSPQEEAKLRQAHRDKYHTQAAEEEKLTIEEHKAKFDKLPAEEQKQKLEEHMAKFDPDPDAIKTVAKYIEEITETHQLGTEFLWTYHDHRCDGNNREQYYTAFLCKTPCKQLEQTQYKLYVRELKFMKLRVYYRSFKQIPVFNINSNSLWIFDRATNQLEIICFEYVDSLTTTTKIRVELPQEIKVKQDPSSNETYRQQLATNLIQHFQEEKAASLDQAASSQ